MPADFSRARVGLLLTFAAMGFASSSAATRLAEIKGHLGVSDSIFGYALALTTVGSFVGNTFAHRIALRLGTQRVVQIFGVLMMSSVALYGSVNAVWQLGVMAFLCAVGYSTMNVAINAQGVDVEVHLKRSVMPSFHGAWSIGSLVTSIIGGLLAIVLSPQWHLIAIGVIAITAMLFASRSLLPVDELDEDLDHTARVNPETLKRLFFTAIGASLGLIAEVSALDWSSIYLHEYVGVSLGLNSLGLTTFLLAQIASRLTVGRFNDRHGVHRVVRAGAAFGAVGHMASVLIVRHGLEAGTIQPGSTTALVISCVGFMVLGIGVGPLPAAYFSAAGRVAGISTARGISILAMMNAGLLLLLRPFVAWSTDAFDISVSLMLAALALLGSAALARMLRPTAAL